MTKITEIYLNFHGDRPSMPFTSEAESRAVAQGNTLNLPSEVAVEFVRKSRIEAAVMTERERCARLVEEHQIGSSTHKGENTKYLAKRYEGNLEGLAYADAIRAGVSP